MYLATLRVTKATPNDINKMPAIPVWCAPRAFSLGIDASLGRCSPRLIYPRNLRAALKSASLVVVHAHSDRHQQQHNGFSNVTPQYFTRMITLCRRSVRAQCPLKLKANNTHTLALTQTAQYLCSNWAARDFFEPWSERDTHRCLKSANICCPCRESCVCVSAPRFTRVWLHCYCCG